MKNGYFILTLLLQIVTRCHSLHYFPCFFTEEEGQAHAAALQEMESALSLYQLARDALLVLEPLVLLAPAPVPAALAALERCWLRAGLYAAPAAAASFAQTQAGVESREASQRAFLTYPVGVQALTNQVGVQAFPPAPCHQLWAGSGFETRHSQDIMPGLSLYLPDL